MHHHIFLTTYIGVFPFGYLFADCFNLDKNKKAKNKIHPRSNFDLNTFIEKNKYLSKISG